MIASFWKKYKNLIILFLAFKLFLFAIILIGQSYFSFSEFDYETNGLHSNISDHGLAAYDGQFYLLIADQGYNFDESSDFYSKIYAFFPLYPILIRVFSYAFLGNYLLAGIFLSLIFSFLACLFLYKLFLVDCNKKIAFIGALLWLIFPTAIFYTAIYVEGMFAFLVFACFYFMRKKKWWIAGFFGLLAAVTKSLGIFLIIPFAIEYFLYWKENKYKLKLNFLSIFLLPAGLISFLTYAYIAAGNFFQPIIIQQRWMRESSSIFNIWEVLSNKIINITGLPFHYFHDSILDLFFIIFFIIIFILMLKKERMSYLVYSALMLFVPLSTGTTMSMIRYLSLSFPQFKFLASVTNKNKYFLAMIIVLFLVLIIILTFRFVNWYWAG